jgi:steroid 5-alpha reductase family enzyme
MIQMNHLGRLMLTEYNTLMVNFWELYGCVSQGDAKAQCFLDTDALTCSFFLLVCTFLYCFIWSIVCNNVSKVDQIWSIIPFVYSWVFFFHYYFTNNGVIHFRLLVATLLITLWGIRLTFNFARRGGYGNFIQHEEDYRWPILRKQMNLPSWLLFNLTFIAGYQNLLLWLIALPTYVVYQGPPTWTDLGVLDCILAHVFFFCIVLETVADQQHYDFQEYKYSLTPAERLSSSQKSVREGFFQVKLWKYCRHPNYLAEQCIWLCVYLFSCLSSGVLFNWSAVGIVLLVLLFQGSMQFSEAITLSKYPLYANYLATVPKIIPCLCCDDGMDDIVRRRGMLSEDKCSKYARHVFCCISGIPVDDF